MMSVKGKQTRELEAVAFLPIYWWRRTGKSESLWEVYFVNTS